MKNKNICEHCGFSKNHHSSSCDVVVIRKFVEGSQKFQEYWNKGWTAGFNNGPIPTGYRNFNYIIFSGWEAGREARLELGK